MRVIESRPATATAAAGESERGQDVWNAQFCFLLKEKLFHFPAYLPLRFMSFQSGSLSANH